MNQSSIQKILRLRSVMDWTGLSRSTIYAMIKNGTFPKNVSLGVRSVGWVSTEIESWIASRKTGGMQ
jgi:prophage regulatory protein